jgi:hypothetical protein
VNAPFAEIHWTGSCRSSNARMLYDVAVRLGWSRSALVARRPRHLLGFVVGLAIGGAFLGVHDAKAALLSQTQIYPYAVYDIACPSRSQCTVTAGTFGEPHPGQEVTFNPLAPGTPTPVTIDASQDLFSIACPSVTQCTAGDVSSEELTFNPESPTTLIRADIETGIAYSVACPAEDLCTATGYPGAKATTFDPMEPEGATHFELGQEEQDTFTLACPSVTECIGVSAFGDEVLFYPKATGMQLPVAIDPGVALASLSCPSVSQCTTLASGEELTFNPNSPGIVAPVDLGGRYALESISCPSTEQCTAGAAEGMEVTFNPLVPGSPTPVHIDIGVEANLGANVHQDNGENLAKIDCPSVSQCTAVDSGGRELTFDPDTQSTTNPTTTTMLPTSSSAGPPSSVATPASLLAMLERQLRPSGRTARIPELLRKRQYAFKFKALEAGSARFVWYYLPRHRPHDEKPERVMIAEGHLTCSTVESTTVKMRITPAGRRLMRHSKKLQLLASATFTPVGQASIVATATIRLRA